MTEKEERFGKKEILDQSRVSDIESILDKSKVLLDTDEEIEDWFYRRKTELSEQGKKNLLEKLDENDIVLTLDSLRILIDIFQGKDITECITTKESFVLLQDLIIEYELIEIYADNVTEEGYSLIKELFPFAEEIG